MSSRLGVFFLVFLFLARPAAGSPGSIDQSFGDWHTAGARATISSGVHAVQPDGKIVLALTSGTSLMLSRELPNGDPDGSFGPNGGFGTWNYGTVIVVPRSVALQSDGKIVVAGYLDKQPADGFIARFTANGFLDTSFGSGGWVVVQFGSDTDVFEKVLVQPDGRIVAAGWSLIGGDWDFAVARVDANGLFDNTFNDDGKATIGFSADEKCFDAALQADGKLVMAGESQGLIDDDMAVCRLDVNGHLDPTFHFDGRTTTGFGADDEADAVAIQPDGKILVAGLDNFARYLTNGNLDPSFDGDGKLSVDHITKDIAVRPDGLILAVGYDFASPNFRLFALNPNGTTNTSVASFLGQSTDQHPPFLSLLPDMRMIVTLPGGGGCHLYKLAPNGANDPDGYQDVALNTTAYPTGSNELAWAMAMQPDMKTVLVGHATVRDGSNASLMVTRLNVNGTIDGAFATNGTTLLAPMGTASGRAVALQPDGKILAAGYTTGPNWNFIVARYGSDGVRDGTFGVHGYNILDFGGDDFASAVAVQPDGKILVAGQVTSNGHLVFGVCRLTSSGSLDKTFDVDGRAIHDFASSIQTLTSMVLQPDGKIVLGGMVGNDFGVVRLNANGSVDASFGLGGEARIDLVGTDALNALALMPNGWIVAAGSNTTSGHSRMALLLFSSTGNVLASPPCPTGTCPSWPNGVAYVDWPGASSEVRSLDVRSDGQLLAAGHVGGSFAWAQLGTSSTQPTVGPVNAAWPWSEIEVATGAKFTGCCSVTLAGYSEVLGDGNMMVRRFETIHPLVAVDDAPKAAGGLQLRGPVPNPVRRNTTFAFDLFETRRTRLALYDVAGRLVRTLVDGDLPAGRHGEVWDAADEHGGHVAPGVYFARLDVGVEHARATVIVVP